MARPAKASLPPDVQEYLKVLGLNIKQARLARHWSQTDMAERALMSRLTYNDIEKGVDTVQIGFYLRALDVFDLADQIANVGAPHTDEEGRRLRTTRGIR